MSNQVNDAKVNDTKGDGAGAGKKRFFRRGPWENASTIVIGAGILMLMQPFALALYTWSFVVILAGTIGFLITSHFSE
jgi:hypothetical protein